MWSVFRLLTMVLAFSAITHAQSLNGIRFCIDPGHGGHNPANDRRIELDPGNVFWESEGNFQKALRLDTLLQAQGAWVILTRYTNNYPDDNLEPTLTQRWQLANANNVHWFHSIHSNAFNGSTNYTLVLLKEDIPTRQPAFPQALTMSNIIAPKIQSFLRTPPPARVALDYTFYGGPNGGFNLGVLRGLVMPGELSEGSFHDVLSEYRKLQNLAYNKMEAYALRNSFMQYYSVPADPLGIVAGLQTEIGTGRAINFSQVRLLPANRVYNGDQFNNGFYMFDQIPAGQHTLRFETAGFARDSVNFTMTTGGLVFIDRQFESFAPPTVVSSTPVNGDTLFSANRSIVLQWSKVMDTASVRRAFSITPNAAGRLVWSNTNTTLSFTPDQILPFFVNFTVRVDTQARSLGGQMIDGDGNGVPGDPYVLMFRTRDVDAFPPQIVAAYPASGAQLPSPTSVLNVTFDEPLNPTTVTVTNVAVQKIGGSVLARTVDYFQAGIKSGINVYLTEPLEVAASYRMRVSGVSDMVGNFIPNTSPIIWEFSVSSRTAVTNVIDQLDTSVADWQQPLLNGSTTGVDSASFTVSTSRRVPTIVDNVGSARLSYKWQAGAPAHLLYLKVLSGPATTQVIQRLQPFLQAYIHGDGSGNQFRFVVRDSLGYEVSRWYTLDWIGWRLVEWSLENDSLGSWNGNGVLEGSLRFDGFQLKYLPGTGSVNGVLHFDQVQYSWVPLTSVPNADGAAVAEYRLEQNYPNPFNPSTVIEFSLPKAGHTTLKVYNLIGQEVARVVDAELPAGTHRVQFDAHNLSSGVYLYKLVAGSTALIRKMVVMR